MKRALLAADETSSNEMSLSHDVIFPSRFTWICPTGGYWLVNNMFL